MSAADNLRNQIEDYKDTVFAIIGFLNFYRYDDARGELRDDVIVFQGRRLTPSPDRAVTEKGNRVKHVTPDLGVLHTVGRHVLGDVKKSFPADTRLWIDDFQQLMSYDDDLRGWPCASERVETHDIVLLTHQTRAVRVRDELLRLFEAGKVSFQRPFAIVQFNHGQNADDHYFFQKVYGQLSDQTLDALLYEGRAVMMYVFVREYSTVKLYDAAPPPAYLAWLIWEELIGPRAAEHSKYPKLRKNQKIQMDISVDEIATELQDGFSFKQLHGDRSERQPTVPRKQWCVDACDVLVDCDLAEWVNKDKKDTIRINWRRLDSSYEYILDRSSKQNAVPTTQLSVLDGSLE